MRIHAFSTGSIAVKNRYYAAKGRARLARLTSVLLDGRFREIPIYVWAIEHPEGVVVVDTGLTARVNQPGYFPLLQRPYWRTQYRWHIQPEQEVGAQLRDVGIAPEDVCWVIVTHAHFDHTSALYTFPRSEIIFSRKEYEDVTRFRSAHFAFPSKWPRWLKPRLIDYAPEAIGPFEQSYTLTQAGDVRIVPTPGHTMGHQSVLLFEEGLTYFFAGDTSFDLSSLLDGTLDAPSFNSNEVYKTRRKILDYAQDTPLVYLPTHDHDTANRLDRRETIRQEAAATAVTMM